MLVLEKKITGEILQSRLCVFYQFSIFFLDMHCQIEKEMHWYILPGILEAKPVPSKDLVVKYVCRCTALSDIDLALVKRRF